jgi:siroheme synthase
MGHLVEPQELEPLLDFYRLRYHHMVQNSAAERLFIEKKDREIAELQQQLKAVLTRETKLHEDIDRLKKRQP